MRGMRHRPTVPTRRPDPGAREAVDEPAGAPNPHRLLPGYRGAYPGGKASTANLNKNHYHSRLESPATFAPAANPQPANSLSSAGAQRAAGHHSTFEGWQT